MPPPHERYKAWQLCHELVLKTYGLSSSWPKVELFGLTAQARRAAVSAASNLVEGAAKEGPREFRRFLDIAKGSLAELGYVLRLALDLGYLNGEQWQMIEAARDHAARTVWGLYRVIRRRSRSAVGDRGSGTDPESRIPDP